MAYYFYLILAVVCLIGEVFTMDFSLACFATGLLGASLAAWLGLSLGWQVLIFIVVSIALFTGIRPLAIKYLYHKSKHIKTNMEALIGREALVITAPDPDTRIGRVQVDGDSWRAQFSVLAKANDRVVVEKWEGNTLLVTTQKEESK